MSATKYFTTRQLEEYLDRYQSSTGQQLSFREALLRMDQEGLLFLDPGPVPVLSFTMDHEAFIRSISDRALPAGSILELPEEECTFLSDQERVAFPPGRDAFTRKLINGIRRYIRCPEYFDIYFVTSGRCTIDFSGDVIDLKAGDLCVLPPKAPQLVTLENGAYVWDIMIRSSNFDSRFGELMTMSGVFSGFFRESLYGQSQPNFLLLHTPAGDRELMLRLRGLVIECCSSQDNHTNSCATSWMKLLLVQALRSCGDKVEIYHFPTGGNPRADCGEILQYIQQNSRTVRLSTLAKEFHYNETYLSRMLQNYAHQSFTEIVRDIRMNRAVDYLTNSSLRVHEIAGLVGYSSVDHFSRAFKAIYGVSPQGYRRKNRT